MNAFAPSCPTPAALLPFPLSPTETRQARLRLALYALAQERHFRRRVRERYAFTLTPERYREWIAKVEDVHPGTKFLRPAGPPGRTLWRIRCGRTTLRVVYDETTRRLVTCLPARFGELPIKRLRRLRAQHAFVESPPAAESRLAAA